jgi:hypothetical protein
LCLDKRKPRYGVHLYEVRVTNAVASKGVLYLSADSLVVKVGALMLAVEIDPVEAEEWEEGEQMEMPPSAVFAPGHWYSAIMVLRDDHEPRFDEHPMADHQD